MHASPLAGAPRRLAQLAREGIYSRLRGRTLTVEEVEQLAAGRYAFINVWRSIDEAHPVRQPAAHANPSPHLRPLSLTPPPVTSTYLPSPISLHLSPFIQVMQQPLAVCDEASVAADDRFLYQLRFPDRTGENYSLRHSARHKWYYYPQQTREECLVFKVYDKKVDGPRFVFHTAFTDPSTPSNAPPRKSIEVRAIAFYDPPPL